MSENPAIPFALPFTHYASLGYHPIPIKPGQKIPAGGKNWNTKQYDYVKLDAGNYSVGLLCDNVAGFDIDALDPARANAIEDLCRKICRLPKNTVVRVGMAPKRLLIVRVDAPMKGCDAEGFQLLGAGKQFVLHGIHPDTHLPYTLSRALPATHALPLVTPGMISELQLALGVRKKMESTPAPESPRWDDRNMGLAADKLMQIDPDLSYPDWFKVACAIHAGTHGDAEGFEMFDMWSSTGKKYKHDAVVTLWRSIRPGKGVNTGTLFANDFPKIREPKFEQKPNENIGGLTWDLGEVQKEETPPTYWFAQDLITIGAHLLIAKAKAGKSLLIVQAAYAHATGGIFLGRECVKTKVLLFAAENTRTEIKQILRRLGLVFPIGMVDLWTMERIEDGTVERCALNEWIHEYLQARPECKVVILDTMVTAEARWGGDEVDKKSRQAPVTEQAYQRFRVYETTAKANVALIWLLHHAGKQKTKVVIDFHESINMPGTALAAVTASLVLAFAPDYDPLMAGSEEGAAQPRILSIRGRFIPEIVYAGELSSTNGFTLLGKYSDVLLSKTQQDFMRAVEALMSDVTPGPDGSRWTTYQAIADERGVSRQSIPQLVARMKQKGLLKWKDKVLVTKPKLGVTLR